MLREAQGICKTARVCVAVDTCELGQPRMCDRNAGQRLLPARISLSFRAGFFHKAGIIYERARLPSPVRHVRGEGTVNVKLFLNATNILYGQLKS